MLKERTIRKGGNQTGTYKIICTDGKTHWRTWDNPPGDTRHRQVYIGPCDCKK